ncbi:MAG: fibronectin type III domain-containing protein [Gammaproteobacteria bacterium]|jgi:hypothetical protein|nr:fibronectin type III domain-containing protein [Gammaproteobacteria bacterium]
MVSGNIQSAISWNSRTNPHFRRNVRQRLLLLALTLTLVGCGDFDYSSESTTEANVSPTQTGGGTNLEIPSIISGSIGDGPIEGAQLQVYSNNGQLLEQFDDTPADYEITITASGGNYPLSVRAAQGTGLVTGLAPDFTLLSVVENRAQRTVSNLNPFSTLIYKLAELSGRVNRNSIAAARNTIMTRYSFGLDAAAFPDPVTTEVTPDNIHLIVKSSESLGEMVRRTRDALLSSGVNYTGDEVVDALAADLTDGWLDGTGGSGSSARVAAIANIASAAVLLESMTNQLRVNGTDASAAMDMAIRLVRSGAPAASVTGNVSLTDEVLEQAVRSLWAAHVLRPDERILDTIGLLEATTAGTLPGDLATALPAGLADVLRQATTEAAYADTFTLDTINSQAAGAESLPEPQPEPEPEPQPEPQPEPGPEPQPAPEPQPEPQPEPEPTPAPEPAPVPVPTNTPPVITGTPATNLTAGDEWSFLPTAADADGDSLRFTLTGAPAWISYSNATGFMTGTAEAGVYANIVLSVSDGQATTQLAPFTLTVAEPQPPATGSATLTWRAPEANVDGSALTSISAYRIYYGLNPTNPEQVTTVSGTLTEHTIDGLAAGNTWYFQLAAVDAEGVEGLRTNPISKNVP